MITLWIEFSWNHDSNELTKYLVTNKLTIIHQGKKVEQNSLQPGMALKHESGAIMRIMSRFSNHENLSHDYLLASKSMKSSQRDLFIK